MSKELTNIEKGFLGESIVFEKLKDIDPGVEWCAFPNRYSKADFILSNGKSIDVKYAAGRLAKVGKYTHKSWNFNVHHHNKKQTGIDFFICCLIKDDKNILFVFPSKLISGYNLRISERQLNRGKYDYFIENWELLKK